jgi:type I restriction enzyme S subunit
MSFISTDVAVPGLNRDFAHSRVIILPEGKILQLFEDTVIPLHRQMDVLRNIILKLQNARDHLLPRLMNGEIAV